MTKNIAVIRGDGIGPEIVGQAIRVLDRVAEVYGHTFNYTDVDMGGCAIDKYGDPLPQSELEKCVGSDSVLLGAVGLPVFSGGAGGFAKLFGVTGGYIVGYIPCALISGLFVDLFYKKNASKNPFVNGAWAIPVGMIAGTVVLYALGTIWYIIARGVTLEVALASCVVQFLIGDTIKIICATVITVVLRDRLSKIMR